MICLALLVFCLVERAVRKAIAPAIELAGLYVGRPAKATGRLVFEALARLRLHPARATTRRPFPHPTVAGQAVGAAQRRPDPPTLGELTDRRTS